MLEVLLSAVRACLPPLLCAKPVGEAGGTEVLATADGEVSIAKDLCADGAGVLAGNSAHKLVVISTIDWLVTGRKRHAIIIYCYKLSPSHFLPHLYVYVPSPLMIVTYGRSLLLQSIKTRSNKLHLMSQSP